MTGGAGFCVGLTGAAFGAAAKVGAGVAVGVGVGVGVGLGDGVGVDVADIVGASVVEGAPPPTPPGFEVRLVGPELVAGASVPAHAQVDRKRTPTIPQPITAAARLVEPSKGARDLIPQPLAINTAISRTASPRKVKPGLPINDNIHRAHRR